MTTKLAHMDSVAIEFRGSTNHGFGSREAFFTSDCGLQVGGGRPSAGMTGKRLSLPYVRIGGDSMGQGSVIGVLASGDLVLKANDSVAVNRVNYPTIMAAAMAITPADSQAASGWRAIVGREKEAYESWRASQIRVRAS